MDVGQSPKQASARKNKFAERFPLLKYEKGC